MSTVIDSLERSQLRRLPAFDAGDRLRVHFQVIEGTRRRTQVFEGVVIKRQGHGARETFTVRKQSFGVGVERMFPVHSPKIDQLEVVARGDVRRAKLYYLRGRVGKRARVAERRWGIDDALVAEEPVADPESVEYEEPPAEADPVSYQAPESEPIAEGAAVVPADAEGAEEVTEAEQAAAIAKADVASAEGEQGPDGAESAKDAEAAPAASSEDSERS